jgi:ATP-binding cassette subfamily F protein 3
MIQLRNLKLQYGERFIFRDATATIGNKDRIGLVGSNGAGKTTLLKILADQEELDGGFVDKAKYVTIGYLPQDGIIAADRSLYEEVESAFENVLTLTAKIGEASTQLQSLNTESKDYHEILELIGTWERELENHDVEKLPSRIESVLQGLGFEQSDMERQTSEFSGGWQMRIALAKLLLASPSLLLLDEPTNHLDIISQRWLENYLKRYEGAILMVSHDRAFLDELCKQTFELTQGNLNVYQGGYSYFEEQSKIRKEQLIRSFKNQQKEIERTEKFIDRFRYKASKASQVQSRIKALDKVDRIEIETEENSIAFSFPPAPRSGQTIMELESDRERDHSNRKRRSTRCGWSEWSWQIYLGKGHRSSRTVSKWHSQARTQYRHFLLRSAPSRRTGPQLYRPRNPRKNKFRPKHHSATFRPRGLSLSW